MRKRRLQTKSLKLHHQSRRARLERGGVFVLVWVLNVFLGGCFALQIQLDQRVQGYGSLRKWQTSICTSLLILATSSAVMACGQLLVKEEILPLVWTGCTYLALLVMLPVIFRELSVITGTPSGFCIGISVNLMALGGMLPVSWLTFWPPLIGTVCRLLRTAPDTVSHSLIAAHYRRRIVTNVC